LEEHLLVAKNEFFVGFRGILKSVDDHSFSIPFAGIRYKVLGLYR